MPDSKFKECDKKIDTFGDIYVFPPGMTQVSSADGVYHYKGKWSNEDIKDFIHTQITLAENKRTEDIKHYILKYSSGIQKGVLTRLLDFLTTLSKE